MKGNQILFEVEAVDRVVVKRFERWECRGECALQYLCDLGETWRNFAREHLHVETRLRRSGEALWRSANGRLPAIDAGNLAAQ